MFIWQFGEVKLLFYCRILLVNVVAEKERKIKEAMKVMGLGNFALWYDSLLYLGGSRTLVLRAEILSWH